MSPRYGAFTTFSGRSLLMLVTMSNKELHRLSVIQAVIEKRLRRCDAASQLQLTERQVQWLMNRYRESGAAGLTNARRDKPGTHRIADALRCQILTLLRENYVGFAPTLAAKTLQPRHGFTPFRLRHYAATRL